MRVSPYNVEGKNFWTVQFAGNVTLTNFEGDTGTPVNVFLFGYISLCYRVPTRHGTPFKMTVHLEKS